MPRKGPAPKRPLVVDPVHNSPLVTQLVNKILLDATWQAFAASVCHVALTQRGCRNRAAINGARL